MKKGKKWKKIEAFCILLIVTLLLIFVRILYQPGTESERGELYTFSNGWYQLEVCIGDRLLYQYKDNRFEKKQADERENMGRYFFAGENRAGSVINQL